MVSAGLIIPPLAIISFFSPSKKDALSLETQKSVKQPQPPISVEKNNPIPETNNRIATPFRQLPEQQLAPHIGLSNELIPNQLPFSPQESPGLDEKNETDSETEEHPEEKNSFSEFALMQPITEKFNKYQSPLTGKSSTWESAPLCNEQHAPVKPENIKKSKNPQSSETETISFGNTFDDYQNGGGRSFGFGHGGGSYNPFGGSSSYGGGFSPSYSNSSSGNSGGGARDTSNASAASANKKPSVSCSVGDSASSLANALNSEKDSTKGGLPLLPPQQQNYPNEHLLKAILEQQRQQQAQNGSLVPQQNPGEDPLFNEASKVEQTLEKKIFDGGYDEKQAEESLKKIEKKVEEDIKKTTANKPRIEASQIKLQTASKLQEALIEPVVDRLTKENTLVQEDEKIAQQNQELAKTEQILTPLIQQAQQDPTFQTNPQKSMALFENIAKRSKILEERKKRVKEVLQTKEPRHPALNFIKKADKLIERSTGQKTILPPPSNNTPKRGPAPEKQEGVLDKVSNAVSSTASSLLEGAQNFAAQNPDLIKTGLGVAGSIAPALLPLGLGYAGSMIGGALSLPVAGAKGIGSVANMALSHPGVVAGGIGAAAAAKIAYDLYQGHNIFKKEGMLKNHYLAKGVDAASFVTQKTVDGTVAGAKLANNYVIQPGWQKAKEAVSWSKNNVLTPTLNLLGFGK